MKRVKLRKASKRVSCSKRYKIQKKVREHHRKVRREAKKKGGLKRSKKDPGVPNSAPFKEEVLREAEQRRLQIEAEQERKKQAKKEERTKKRKQDKENSKDTEPHTKKARKDDGNSKDSLDKNSKKHLCLQLNKVIDLSDVVLEVLDARDPLGYRCPQLEEAVLQRGNKKLILVINKIDLVPKENVEKWIQCLQAELPVVAFKASTLVMDKSVQSKKLRKAAANNVPDHSWGATCFGSTCLTELIEALAANTKDKASIKVGVVGFPNVGKSSIINSLKGIRACHVNITKGTTKTMQEVHFSKTVNLMDSPGILASESSPPASMALRGQHVEESTECMNAAESILKQCDRSQIMLQYSVASFHNGEDFLKLLAKKYGYLKKGGLPDTDQAATSFLRDWSGPKLSFHCEVQEDHTRPAYITDTVVAQQQEGLDLDRLKTGNSATLKEVKFPTPAKSISFHSTGLTEGLLQVNDMEGRPVVAAATEEQEEQVKDTEQAMADASQDEIPLADPE